MTPDKQALEEARAALDKLEQAWANVNFEVTPCPTCGRVIYCGVSTLCKVRPCGLIKEN